MTHIAIQINESEVYIQRRGLETTSENPLTIEEEIIIKLYDDIQDANDTISRLMDDIDWYEQQQAGEDY